MQTMYSAIANSPSAVLANIITSTATTINVNDATKLPDAPNLATLGQGEISETILYTGKIGNSLTGVTRGFQGIAKAWEAGTPIARYFTAYDHDTFKDNITELENNKLNKSGYKVIKNVTNIEGVLSLENYGNFGKINFGNMGEELKTTIDGLKFENNLLWHEGNDGSGSGLDADLLDGNHASDFAKQTDLTTHLADVTQLPSEIVTVGSGGDYQTINDALEYLSKKQVRYFKEGYTAEILLKSGFIMKEQIIVKGQNLGWITISSEDTEVVIQRSSLTRETIAGSFPALCAYNNATLPIINTLFNMDSSGDGSNRDGILCFANSKCSILEGCGIKNSGGRGIYVIQSSAINAQSADVSGAGGHGIYVIQSSAINAQSADVSGAGGHGIYAQQGSIVNFRSGNVSGAGDIGVACEGSSLVHLYNSNISNYNGKAGVLASLGGFISVFDSNAQKNNQDSPNDFKVEFGGIISIRDRIDLKGGFSQALNVPTASGIIFK